MSGLIRGWRSPLPVEETVLPDWVMLLLLSLPIAVMTFFLHAAADESPSAWWLVGRFVATLLVGSVVRYSPWFGRPEATHLFAVVGWFFGEFVGLIIWHSP